MKNTVAVVKDNGSRDYEVVSRTADTLVVWDRLEEATKITYYRQPDWDREGQECWAMPDSTIDFKTNIYTDIIKEEVSMSKQDKITKLMAKVEAGELTLAEALLEASKAPAYTSRAKVDRVAEAQSLDSIEELNKAYKRAASKMSSVKKRVGAGYETHPSYLRYLEEFETIKARKNEVYSGEAKNTDRVRAAIKIGSSDNAILQAFMIQMKDELENRALNIRELNELTRTQFKDSVNKMPNKAPAELLEKLEEYKEGLSTLYLNRSERDMFVVKLNKLAQLVTRVEKRRVEKALASNQ